MTTLLVAIPVCHKDIEIVLANLDRCIQLDGKVEHGAFIWYDKSNDLDVLPVIEKAKKYFASVHSGSYELPNIGMAWPRPQNYAWQNCARTLEQDKQSIPVPLFDKRWSGWLWWEADAIPLKAGWLDTLAAAYKKSNKAFLGHIVEGRGHMNGVAIYPFLISNYCMNALLVKGSPFDVALSDEAKQHIARGNDLIGHKLKLFGGDAPEPLDLTGVPDTCVLYHGATIRFKMKQDQFEREPVKPIKSIPVIESVSIVATRYSLQITIDRPTLWHVTERHKTKDAEAERRSLQAEQSWLRLYELGEMKPAHLWDYPRSSVTLGDKRGLPYLKDVLAEGLTHCAEHDIIVWTNDDTILHEGICAEILLKLSLMNACSSFRYNIPKGTSLPFRVPLDESRSPDLGRDLFAMRASWLKKHWNEIPDMLLGELEFDLVMAILIRRTHGVKSTKQNLTEVTFCELVHGYVLHEAHERAWMNEPESNPAKAHNRKLAKKWLDNL